ncbi:SH3 domain-containing protein [Rheinheimera soli]|uniref:Type II secretory pathway component PulM n=1 Tax=Rheinheimera soli TaxID=443616 RepID=A0ABU1W1B8_9GAMM|nr:SH3 domain-containing protein [Rheinheimera soli]MDR7121600.1 type II secretory pathway component PulM [Rheinheimera soli]
MSKDNDLLKGIHETLRTTSDLQKEYREMIPAMTDPLKEHRELMASFGDPLQEHREMIAAMIDPLKEHRELMASFGDPLQEHREMIAAMTDPLKEHRELMASLGDPLQEHREMIAAMTDPLKEHRELMASFGDPLQEHREMIAAMTDPLKEYRELMTSFGDPLKEHREMIAAMTAPLKEYRELMASFGAPLNEHRAFMASMTDPLKEFRASIAAIQNPFKEFSTSYANISALKFLKDMALEIGNDLSFEQDGVVSLASKRMAVSELQDLSYQVIQESSLEPSDTLEESLNNLIEEIRSQKDPVTQKLLMWFIYPLIVAVIVSVINPFVDHHVKSYLNEDKRALSKKIESTLGSSVGDRAVLKDFRYVSADVLNVRYSSSQKSETIGYLYFGYAVIVIDRQKSWTLVEWNDPDSEVRITGWVFSRYLAKFK